MSKNFDDEIFQMAKQEKMVVPVGLENRLQLVYISREWKL